MSNILGDAQISDNIDESKLTNLEEIQLYSEIKAILPNIELSVKNKKFDEAMQYLCNLSPATTKFFDNVMVNDTDINIANNRKAILKLIAKLFEKIAHFERMM